MLTSAFCRHINWLLFFVFSPLLGIKLLQKGLLSCHTGVTDRKDIKLCSPAEGGCDKDKENTIFCSLKNLKLVVSFYSGANSLWVVIIKCRVDHGMNSQAPVLASNGQYLFYFL